MQRDDGKVFMDSVEDTRHAWLDEDWRPGEPRWNIWGIPHELAETEMDADATGYDAEVDQDGPVLMKLWARPDVADWLRREVGRCHSSWWWAFQPVVGLKFAREADARAFMERFVPEPPPKPREAEEEPETEAWKAQQAKPEWQAWTVWDRKWGRLRPERREAW